MRALKLFIIAITLLLFSSCGTLDVTTQNGYDMNYDYYNYNQIHLLYESNPRFFYDNVYMDAYGATQYYYTHRYYIRYCKEYKRKHNKRRNMVSTHREHSNHPARLTRTDSTPRYSKSIRGTRSTSEITPTRSTSRSYNTRSNTITKPIYKETKRRTVQPTQRRTPVVRKSTPIRNNRTTVHKTSQRRNIQKK